MSSRRRQVSLAMLLVLLFPDERLRSDGAPICAPGETGCQALSLADLFDRVIQHSARMHGLSNDLHSQFEQYFLPNGNQIARTNRKCHTSAILTPDGKENAQRLARQELTEVILKLLAAWREPLWQLHQSMAHQQDFNSYSGNKALDMSDMAHKLRAGVERVAEKMQLLGMLSNAVGGLPGTQALQPPPPSRGQRSLSQAQLLHCFRRDSHKVHNYLRLLKCTIVPEQGC